LKTSEKLWKNAAFCCKLAVFCFSDFLFLYGCFFNLKLHFDFKKWLFYSQKTVEANCRKATEKLAFLQFLFHSLMVFMHFYMRRNKLVEFYIFFAGTLAFVVYADQKFFIENVTFTDLNY